MNRRIILCAVTALLFGGFFSAGIAHHSVGAAYDMTAEGTIAGTVVRFEWTNPHSWLWMDVENPDETVTRWGFEGMSPNFIARRGWDKNSVQPGDQIEALFFPLKNGESGGTLLRVTFDDGTEKIMWNRRADP